MAMGRFKLSFTTEESEIPSLVCQAPSNTENFRSRHEEVADMAIYCLLKDAFYHKATKYVSFETNRKNGSQVLAQIVQIGQLSNFNS